LNGVEAINKIIDTDAPFYRPPLPHQESDGVHPGILTLMKQCWAEEPSERPSFKDVIKCLKIINNGKLEYWCFFAKYCDEYVCLCVRMSVHSHNTKTARPNFTNFFACCLRSWLSPSCSDGVAIRYVLPVLWMTSCLHTTRDQWAVGHGVVWFAAWRYRRAWPLAGRKPLRPTGSLARRAGLLGRLEARRPGASVGADCPAAGLGCCRELLCTFRPVLHPSSDKVARRGRSLLSTMIASCISRCVLWQFCMSPRPDPFIFLSQCCIEVDKVKCFTINLFSI